MPLQRQTEDIVRRLIPALGYEILTDDLDDALDEIIAVLERAGRKKTVKAVEASGNKLAAAGAGQRIPYRERKGTADTESA